MNPLYEIRKEFGGVYVTVIDDNLIIPWKPLSVGDYLKYNLDLQRQTIPSVHLENEIFSKCVVDKSFIRRLSSLKAGTISTVVQNIFEYSGPTTAIGFNTDIDTARALLSNKDFKVIHELVELISLAFPYKPEEIYAMDYQTFLTRVAQSESKLLFLKIITEPIALVIPDEESFNKVTPPIRKKVNAKEIWDQQQAQAQKIATANPLENNREKWYDVSPVLEAKNKKPIDFEMESEIQKQFGPTHHQKHDLHIERAKMTDEARIIYAELIAKLAQKKV